MLDVQYRGELSVEAFIVVDYFDPGTARWTVMFTLNSYRWLPLLLRCLDA